MKQKKKGFTLTEVMVVILVSTLVLAMVGGVMIFITTTTSELIQEAEEIEMAKNIEKYYRNLHNSGNEHLDYNLSLENGNIMNDHTGDVIFFYTGLTDFDILYKDGDDFVRCKMIFESGKQFDFIIGTQD